MINLHIAIKNPWHDEEKNPFVNYHCWNGFISKYKSWEIEITRYTFNLFEFSLDLRFTGHDHAGPSFEINLFGYTLTAGIHDGRHWNDKENKWMNYDSTGDAS